jgi:nucleoside 2-deoxyribosyltransferase
MSRQLTAFIGGPFKAFVDPATGSLAEIHQARYRRLINFFEESGWNTFNAHREEGWGKNMVSAKECTTRDLLWMRTCDLFVAFPGCPASPGTHVEIGWASALRRPTVLILNESDTYAALVTGLQDIASVEYVNYDESTHFLSALTRAANLVATRSDVHWRLNDR